MRILLDYRPALRQRTGVGEYVHELATTLVRTTPAGPAGPTGPAVSETITLFSSSWKHRLDPAVVPGAAVVDRAVPGHVLNLAWHRLGWPPIERLTAQRFDVVQAFHPLLIPSTSAARIVTIHDLDFLDHPERTRGEIRRDYPSLAGAHARRADHVVVNSLNTAGEVERRLGVPADRITVCTPGAPPWAPRTGEPPDGCILFLGTLEPRKNLGVLLDAYERLRLRRPNAPRLVLAGGAAHDSAELLARIGRAPLAGAVDLPGYVAPADREALYRRALLFVMPSHTEGFGMPVLEAMTVGVPVVVANRGALPEVAGDAGRYFEPGDADGLAEALATLSMSEGSVRQGMRERGWARARRYDWRASAANLRLAWSRALETQQARHRTAAGRAHG